METQILHRNLARDPSTPAATVEDWGRQRARNYQLFLGQGRVLEVEAKIQETNQEHMITPRNGHDVSTGDENGILVEL